MGRKALYISVFRPINVLSMLGLCVLGALVFCGGAAARVPGMGAAQAFHRYPVYWAGDEVLGMPLESIDDSTARERSSNVGWDFGYGTCELQGTDHPSCSLPLDVQVSSTCHRWAARLDRTGHLFNFRGAKAYWQPGLPLEGGGVLETGPLEIFTGRVTVVFWADTKKIAFAAARALRTVHQSHPFRLAPPAAGTLEGKLPCQQQATRELERE
jgi:hypothetical protein